jgi:hypothetical protein
MIGHAWTQQPGEPTLWHDRFVRFYLSQGPGRTLSEAYRSFQSQGGTGVDPVSRRCNGGANAVHRTPGPWYAASSKWQWASRAKAWDRHQIEELLRARAEQVKKAHDLQLQLYQYVFNQIARQAQQVRWHEITSPREYVDLLSQVTHMQRLLYMNPMRPEEPKPVPASEGGPVDEAAVDAFDTFDDPKFIAEVIAIHRAHGASLNGTGEHAPQTDPPA